MQNFERERERERVELSHNKKRKVTWYFTCKWRRAEYSHVQVKRIRCFTYDKLKKIRLSFWYLYLCRIRCSEQCNMQKYSLVNVMIHFNIAHYCTFSANTFRSIIIRRGNKCKGKLNMLHGCCFSITLLDLRVLLRGSSFLFCPTFQYSLFITCRRL